MQFRAPAPESEESRQLAGARLVVTRRGVEPKQSPSGHLHAISSELITGYVSLRFVTFTLHAHSRVAVKAAVKPGSETFP